jgi:hypothetical protein
MSVNEVVATEARLTTAMTVGRRLAVWESHLSWSGFLRDGSQKGLRFLIVSTVRDGLEFLIRELRGCFCVDDILGERSLHETQKHNDE